MDKDIRIGMLSKILKIYSDCMEYVNEDYSDKKSLHEFLLKNCMFTLELYKDFGKKSLDWDKPYNPEEISDVKNFGKIYDLDLDDDYPSYNNSINNDGSDERKIFIEYIDLFNPTIKFEGKIIITIEWRTCDGYHKEKKFEIE